MDHMTIIFCPVCGKRIFDSDKRPKVEKLNVFNGVSADLIIKCHNCKNCLSVVLPSTTQGTWKATIT